MRTFYIILYFSSFILYIIFCLALSMFFPSSCNSQKYYNSFLKVDFIKEVSESEGKREREREEEREREREREEERRGNREEQIVKEEDASKVKKK
jgi:hypothetical protein